MTALLKVIITSFSYSDIVIEEFDKKVLEYNPLVIGWKRFANDIAPFTIASFCRRS